MEIFALNMKKRILVIASITDIAPAKYLVQEFKKLGAELLVISDEKYENVDIVETKAVDIEKVCLKKNFKPEIVLFIEGGNMNLFPTNMENLQCMKLWWGIDTQYDYEKHLLISRLFDHSFIAQKDFVSKLQRDGISSVSWFPLAIPETDIEITASNRKFDISYVGSQNWQLYPQRKTLIDLIKKNYKNIFVGAASASEMMQIYRDSKIVLNFSLKNDINMRVFEAIGAGALLLTNEVKGNGINDLLESKKDYDTYSSSEDLLTKIDYYLKNENQRSEIATSGYTRIITSHKYSDRAKEILNYNPIKTISHSVSIFNTGAVLSMFNFYPDAFNLFVKAAKENKKGNRSKLLFLILQIVARPVILILKFVEKLLSKLK
jgi:hypothetical protein